jgi:hypothetical protein
VTLLVLILYGIVYPLERFLDHFYFHLHSFFSFLFICEHIAWSVCCNLQVICTSRDGDKFWRMPECYIRGSTIKYLRLGIIFTFQKEGNTNLLLPVRIVPSFWWSSGVEGLLVEAPLTIIIKLLTNKKVMIFCQILLIIVMKYRYNLKYRTVFSLPVPV